MKRLSRFISILELTREQPQFGYFLAGIHKEQTSNLAEHHYLVTMLGWMLCEYLNEEESLVDTNEVMRICLVHDLGEIFGGDMAAPLSRKRPDLKVHAQSLERGNMDILLSFLKPSIAQKVNMIWEKEEAKNTNEAWVAKIADLVETHFFLEHRNMQHPQKDAFFQNHVRPMAERFSDPRITVRIKEFFEGFEEDVNRKGFTPMKWILD